MDFGQLYTIFFNQPITNILFASYQILQQIGVPYAFGFSIIILTILIRVILLPVTASQIKMSKKMQEVAPHMAAMKEKHKGDRKRQQEEMMRLYKEFNINPAAGCLPLLIQLPIFFSLYHVLAGVVGEVSRETINGINRLLYFDWMMVDRIWDPSFLGVPLGAVPSKDFGTMPYLVLIPVITGFLQFVLTKMMAPEVAPKTTKEDDFQATFAKQSLFILPIMIGFFSFSFPVGLSLYWNVFSIFGIIQQYFQAGPGGLKPWIEKLNSNGKNK